MQSTAVKSQQECAIVGSGSPIVSKILGNIAGPGDRVKMVDLGTILLASATFFPASTVAVLEKLAPAFPTAPRNEKSRFREWRTGYATSSGPSGYVILLFLLGFSLVECTATL